MKTINRVGVVCAALFALLSVPGRVDAACTDDDGAGPGILWTCAVATTQSEFNSARSSAPDGATFTFRSGTYTWNAGVTGRMFFSATKAITMICEVRDACVMNWSLNGTNTLFDITSGTTPSSKVWRISGFKWVSTVSDNQWFYVCSGGSCPEVTYSGLRIDHNTFEMTGVGQWFVVDSAARIYLFGLIDNNTFNIANQANNTIIPASTQDTTSPLLARMGTASNLYIEDNVFNVAANTSNNDVGCFDMWGSYNGAVLRFNTFVNCRVLAHDVNHGGGHSNWEVYGNTFVYNAGYSVPAGSDNKNFCYRTIHNQGAGTSVVFDNSMECFTATTSGAAIEMVHYRSFGISPPSQADICNGDWPIDGNRQPEASYEGYPCFHQPGRDMDLSLWPVPVFKNRRTSTSARVVMSIYAGAGQFFEYSKLHMQYDRDIYIEGAGGENLSKGTPFTGASGVGFGALANRPSTCTGTPEALDAGRGGVMYWATDQGNWNSSNSNPYGLQRNGEDGVLYQCSNPNGATENDRWTVYYTPYTYPHPLQTGQNPGVGGGATGVRVRLR